MHILNMHPYAVVQRFRKMSLFTKNTVGRHYWRHIFQSGKFESHAKIDQAKVDQIEPILD